MLPGQNYSLRAGQDCAAHGCGGCSVCCLLRFLFWSSSQEKSPRLRIQVQSIVEAVRADRRSRSGTSDSAIFTRFLMHKSQTAQPIQEGNTSPGSPRKCQTC